MRRRIWSEDVPFEVLRSPGTLALLRTHGLDVLVAVRPGSRAGLAEVLDACAGEGVRAGVWPMLEDAEGRWANAHDAPVFVRFVRELLDDLGGCDRLPAEVAIDLEPSFENVKRFLRNGSPRALSSELRDEAGSFDRGRDEIATLVAEIAARGVATSCAAVPLVLLDPPAPWQRLLGTPVDGPAWDHASVMLYTSIIEGWSLGLVGRRDATALLAWAAEASRARFGARAGLSLGAVGTGAFGSEPVYRSPEELAEDVAVARAAGVDDLTLLDLGGVLARPPAEAWLRAFVETEPAASAPRQTFRARAAVRALRASGGALGALGSLREAFLGRKLA